MRILLRIGVRYLVVGPLHTSSSLRKDVPSVTFVPYARDDLSVWLELDSHTLIVIWIFSRLLASFNLVHFPNQSHYLNYFGSPGFLYPRPSFPSREAPTPSLMSPCILTSWFFHCRYFPLPLIVSYLCSPPDSSSAGIFLCPWLSLTSVSLLTDRLEATLAGSFRPVSSGPATSPFLVYSEAFLFRRLLECAGSISLHRKWTLNSST